MITQLEYQERIHGLKSGGRMMASARNDAPKAPCVGCEEGVSPSLPGEGAMPPPGNFSVFELDMASFGAF